MIQKKRQLFHIHRIQDASSEWISKPFVDVAFTIDFFEGLLVGCGS